MIKYILLFLFPLSVLAQDPSIIWSFEMEDMAFGQAAAADVDGDGLLEVTFSTYRNNGRIYMLNGEDGSELWSMDAGGCADAAPLIYDIDMDGDLEVILAGSCDPTTYCFDADSGFIQWSTPMRGSDSPPTVADVDNDGKPEILQGQFGGYVLCLNGEDGSEVWELEIDTDSWIQTAPTILDVDDDGQLDFIVATWSFFDNHMVAAYRGDDASEIWVSDTPEDYIYHGVSYGDMDNDGDVELVIGDYSGQLICLDAASGETNWTYILPSLPLYIGGPTSMGDIDNDGELEVVFNDWFRIAAIDHDGEAEWIYDIPDYGQAFRGAALADVNGDEYADVTFCSSEGLIFSLNGNDGSLIRSIDLESDFGIDFDAEHGPLVADFNNDGILDVFAAGGHAEYPEIENNYGGAYMVSWGEGNGPEWRMFRRDYWRTACICNDSLLAEDNEPVYVQWTETYSALHVYPQPFSSQLSLDWNYSASSAAISLKDQNGRVVQSWQSTLEPGTAHLEVNRIPPGVYILQIRTDSALYSRQVIRQ